MAKENAYNYVYAFLLLQPALHCKQEQYTCALSSATASHMIVNTTKSFLLCILSISFSSILGGCRFPQLSETVQSFFHRIPLTSIITLASCLLLALTHSVLYKNVLLSSSRQALLVLFILPVLHNMPALHCVHVTHKTCLA